MKRTPVFALQTADRPRRLIEHRSKETDSDTERLNAVVEFVTRLECRLLWAEQSRISNETLAHEILFILKRLFAASSKGGDLEQMLSSFATALRMPLPLNRLLTHLVRRAAILENPASPVICDQKERRALLSGVRQILDWYLRRVAVPIPDRPLPILDFSDVPPGIYDLQIKNGRKALGADGFEVQGLLVLGETSGRARWLKVSLKQQGSLLKTREGWESFSAGPDGGKARPSFAALLPLAHSTALDVEEFKVFVPYQAFALPLPGEDLEVGAEVLDESGRSALNAWTSERIGRYYNLAFLEAGSFPIPAPQSISLWNWDSPSLTALSNVRVSLIAEAPPFAAALDQGRPPKSSLKIVFDCRSALDAGESLEVSCRLLHRDGTELRYGKERSKLISSQLRPITLKAERPLQIFKNLYFKLPWRFLAHSISGEELLVELTVCSTRDRQIHCGLLELFNCRQAAGGKWPEAQVANG